MSWTQVLNQVTPAAATYKGRAKLAKFTFSAFPDQMDFVNTWLVNNYIYELQKQATANNGSQILKLRLWRDTSPTWKTDYKGELELTTPPGFETPFLVSAIIIGALAAIVYYLIVRPAITQVIDLVYGPENPDGERPAIPWGTIAIAAVVAAIVLPNVMSKQKN